MLILRASLSESLSSLLTQPQHRDRSVHLHVTCVCGKPRSQSQVSKTCPSLLRNFYIVRPSFICMYTVFSCEEAALEGQKEVCVSVRVSVRVSPKLNFTFHLSIVNEVYTKPVYCTSVHKTSLLYKCTQNQLCTVSVQ